MTVPCPRCDFSSDTVQGVCAHWGVKHDGPLPDSVDTSEMNSWCRGKNLSESHKEKIRESNIGKNAGEDHGMYGLTGKDCPNYQGGHGEYPAEWNDDIKEFIRQLYHRTCQICGITPDELGMKLDVHHMDGNKQNLDFDNLYPFCRSCHQKVERNDAYRL